MRGWVREGKVRGRERACVDARTHLNCVRAFWREWQKIQW